MSAMTLLQTLAVGAATGAAPRSPLLEKSVQRRFGLFDPSHGMRLLLAAGYGEVKAGYRELADPAAPLYRGITDIERQVVRDEIRKKKKKADPSDPDEFYDDVRSTQGGSAATLTASMLALVQQTLVSAEASVDIRSHLTPPTFRNACLIFDGVKAAAGTPLDGGFAKVGILPSIRAEFAYVEAGGKKFAVVATRSARQGRSDDERAGDRVGRIGLHGVIGWAKPR